MIIPPRFIHQEATVKRLAGAPILLDSSDPGTGKTRSQLDAFAASSGEKAALVIAPKNLLQAAWNLDVQEFTPHIRTSLAYAYNREKAFNVDADMYITNTDAAKWFAKQPPKFFEKFGRLIIDESSKFKNPFSQRSKAMTKIAPYFEKRYELTGTPNPNGVLDLWHQVLLCDDGERLGGTSGSIATQ